MLPDAPGVETGTSATTAGDEGTGKDDAGVAVPGRACADMFAGDGVASVDPTRADAATGGRGADGDTAAVAPP